MGIAQSTWAGIGTVVAFLWGAFVFHEAIRDMPRALIGMLAFAIACWSATELEWQAACQLRFACMLRLLQALMAIACAGLFLLVAGIVGLGLAAGFGFNPWAPSAEEDMEHARLNLSPLSDAPEHTVAGEARTHALAQQGMHLSCDHCPCTGFSLQPCMSASHAAAPACPPACRNAACCRKVVHAWLPTCPAGPDGHERADISHEGRGCCRAGPNHAGAQLIGFVCRGLGA